MFGVHAVIAAITNPVRRKYRLVLTKNAAARINEEIATLDLPIEYADAKNFTAPLAADALHQGVALEVDQLRWPSPEKLCASFGQNARVVLLDRVSDPHNVGAVLRSAWAFDADAVISTVRHAPPETGALAKSASGAIETIPYLRVNNLANAMQVLSKELFEIIGFDAKATMEISQLPPYLRQGRVALALGSESKGLRDLTQKQCSQMVHIGRKSLNVSNAAAIALFATRRIDHGGDPSELANDS